MTSNSHDPVAAFEEARTRIKNCGKEEWFLELSELGLTTLPPEIGQLTAQPRRSASPRLTILREARRVSEQRLSREMLSLGEAQLRPAAPPRWTRRIRNVTH